MGLTVPPELNAALGMIGHRFPEPDEEKLFGIAQLWDGFSTTISGVQSSASSHSQAMVAQNSGESMSAFLARWSAEDAPEARLANGAVASTGVSVGMIIVAIIVLALKIYVIIQLVIFTIQLANAIAAAVPSGGTSLTLIPLFKLTTSLILNLLLDQAISALLGG